MIGDGSVRHVHSISSRSSTDHNFHIFHDHPCPGEMASSIESLELEKLYEASLCRDLSVAPPSTQK